MNHNPKLQLWTGALALWVILGLLNIFYGDLNQDEGWYLYASQRVSEGGVPYKDFAFTQGPVLPYTYALASPVVERWGLAGGRLVTALLGLGSVLLAARLAGVVSGSGRREAALMAFILLAVNAYHSYFTTVVKTYALASFLLLIGLNLLHRSTVRKTLMPAFWAAVFMVLATATRLSAGVAVLAAFIFLILKKERLGRAWIGFAMGAGAASALVFLPFFFAAPDGFLFGMLNYHRLRESGSWSFQLILKAGFLSRMVQAYFVVIALWFILIATTLFPAKAVSEDRGDLGFRGLLWAIVVLVTAVHLTAPFPYDDYQVFIMPVFVAALSGAVVAHWQAGALGGRVSLAGLNLILIVVCGMSAFSSPVNQEWFVLGRDRIWWRMKKESDLVQLNRVAEKIRSVTKDDDLILTQDTYLAVEAGLAVPPGMEMGAFSFYPEWESKKAGVIKVLNLAGMLDILSSAKAPVAAFSGYGLSIQSPEVQPVKEEHRKKLIDTLSHSYRRWFEEPDFGQAHTTLEVWIRKDLQPGT